MVAFSGPRGPNNMPQIQMREIGDSDDVRIPRFLMESKFFCVDMRKKATVSTSASRLNFFSQGFNMEELEYTVSLRLLAQGQGCRA